MGKYVDMLHENNQQNPYPRQLIEYLAKRFDIPEGARVLDVGAGTGDFARAWSQYTGCKCDQMEHPAEQSKWSDYVVDIDKFDSSTDVFGGKLYDVIFSKSTIEHIRNPEKFFEVVRQGLNPDGLLIVMAPDWRTYWYNFYDDPTHVQAYDKVSLPMLAALNKFHVKQSSRIYQMPKVWRNPLLHLIANMIRVALPLPFAVWLAEELGVTTPKWCCQMTLLLAAKPNKAGGYSNDYEGATRCRGDGPSG